jgi:hypothetical protein
MPLQHWASVEQESLFCVQNEPVPEHVPLVQSFEQHSKPCMQGLPWVRHVLRGVHFPPPQTPPQHSAFVVHVWLSAMHWVEPHMPALHTNVQQSPGAEHALPPPRQGPVCIAQTFAPGSQCPLQHSPSAAHMSPVNFNVHPARPPAAPPLLEPPLLAPPLAPPAPGPPSEPADPPAPGPPDVSPLDELPHPMAQRPRLQKATTTQMTSFFTPSSTGSDCGFDAASWDSGGAVGKRLTSEKVEGIRLKDLVGECVLSRPRA